MNSETFQLAPFYRGPGYRIRSKIMRPAPKLMAGWEALPIALISDCMNRMNCMSHSIRNISGTNSRITGPACTVRVFPGDNLFVHAALDVVTPGDVIVIDASGCTSVAVVGSAIAQKAYHRGAKAIIVDGVIRDLTELHQIDLPIFACGQSSVGPLHRGPGEVNFPIQCGGIVVTPGDFIIADTDGIVVVPRTLLNSIRKRVEKAHVKDINYMKSLRMGQFDSHWVKEALDTGVQEWKSQKKQRGAG